MESAPELSSAPSSTSELGIANTGEAGDYTGSMEWSATDQAAFEGAVVEHSLDSLSATKVEAASVWRPAANHESVLDSQETVGHALGQLISNNTSELEVRYTSVLGTVESSGYKGFWDRPILQVFEETNVTGVGQIKEEKVELGNILGLQLATSPEAESELLPETGQLDEVDEFEPEKKSAIAITYERPDIENVDITIEKANVEAGEEPIHVKNSDGSDTFYVRGERTEYRANLPALHKTSARLGYDVEEYRPPEAGEGRADVLGVFHADIETGPDDLRQADNPDRE